MGENQFQETIRKMKEAEKLNKLGKEEREEELRKEEEIELEYERRKKEAAKQLKEGIKLLKKEKKSD
ncbi:MAG: hypothetical protein ACFE9L_01050 [Candidatus Hodarchaeota archaeon]